MLQMCVTVNDLEYVGEILQAVQCMQGRGVADVHDSE